jgi:hydroxymethylpyrimidine/phosphomethylpyrimidine kinase
MTPPRLLTIAGSDSGGGAGIQADLKTFAAHGAYGMSVITALTAQNTREVRAVHEVPPEMVAAQIDAVLEDIGADAIKIGMLASAGTVRAVASRLRRPAAARGRDRGARDEAPAARHRCDPQHP